MYVCHVHTQCQRVGSVRSCGTGVTEVCDVPYGPLLEPQVPSAHHPAPRCSSYLLSMYLCVWHVWPWRRGTHVEVRRVSSLLPPLCVFWVLDSGCQVYVTSNLTCWTISLAQQFGSKGLSIVYVLKRIHLQTKAQVPKSDGFSVTMNYKKNPVRCLCR